MQLKYITFIAVASIASILFLIYVYKTFRFSKTCPICGDEHPDRVARPKLMKLIPSKAYQCTSCRKRYYHISLFESLRSLSA